MKSLGKVCKLFQITDQALLNQAIIYKSSKGLLWKNYLKYWFSQLNPSRGNGCCWSTAIYSMFRVAWRQWTVVSELACLLSSQLQHLGHIWLQKHWRRGLLKYLDAIRFAFSAQHKKLLLKNLEILGRKGSNRDKHGGYHRRVHRYGSLEAILTLPHHEK